MLSSSSRDAVELDRCLATAAADVVSSWVDGRRDCSDPAGVIGRLIADSTALFVCYGRSAGGNIAFQPNHEKSKHTEVGSTTKMRNAACRVNNRSATAQVSMLSSEPQRLKWNEGEGLSSADLDLLDHAGALWSSGALPLGTFASPTTTTERGLNRFKLSIEVGF